MQKMNKKLEMLGGFEEGRHAVHYNLKAMEHSAQFLKQKYSNS
jgi:hypothetical protein